MKRRELITLLGGAAAAWPLTARAQDGRKPARIGYMTPLPLNQSFVQGLRELGYFEGRDFEIEYRNSRAPGSLPALAEELVRLKPDVILAGGLDTVVALRNATQTIPIVSPTLADAVHIGLIASEARPGGNVTGIEPYVAGLPAKEMELAREIVPGARIAATASGAP
jgi:putative ABC transport system substrate-binding protein